MRKCLLCGKKDGPGNGTFFTSPKNDTIRQKWSEICKKECNATTRVCIDHFLKSDVIATGRFTRLLPRAVPIVPEVPIPSTMEIEVIPHCMSPNLQADNFFLDKDHSSTKFSEEKECQTDSTYIEIVLKLYKDKIKSLKSENKELRFQLLQANAAMDSIKKIFTEGQVRSLITPGNVKWKWPDVSNAICLHAASPRAYRHLYSKGFPLPHVSTLQRWCRKIDVSEGILCKTLEFMEQTNFLTIDEKICVLAFDEMKVEETFEYDPINDVVRTPANYVQVVMARGLKKSWKQPVFYNYD